LYPIDSTSGAGSAALFSAPRCKRKGWREAAPDDGLDKAIRSLRWILIVASRRSNSGGCKRISQFREEQTSIVSRDVVIDDRCRLPGRWFGRFATSATSELARAASR
jgi:hypothetical protein